MRGNCTKELVINAKKKLFLLILQTANMLFIVRNVSGNILDKTIIEFEVVVC